MQQFVACTCCGTRNSALFDLFDALTASSRPIGSSTDEELRFDEEEALDLLGIERVCCRKHVLGRFDSLYADEGYRVYRELHPSLRAGYEEMVSSESKSETKSKSSSKTTSTKISSKKSTKGEDSKKGGRSEKRSRK